MSFVVTIDGPAASGKTSVSRGVAEKLGCKWVSSGAFYRMLSYLVQQNHTDITDEKSVAKLIETANWQVDLRPEKTAVLVDGIDVTADIHKEQVGSIASKISQFPLVRKNLLAAQRACADQGDLVAEGRDCGSVVFPQAQAKVYLTARSESRAQRRAAEEGANTQEILEQQKKRDDSDKTRKHSPLQIPEGAHVVDTSELSLEEVIAEVEQYVRQKI